MFFSQLPQFVNPRSPTSMAAVSYLYAHQALKYVVEIETFHSREFAKGIDETFRLRIRR